MRYQSPYYILDPGEIYVIDNEYPSWLRYLIGLNEASYLRVMCYEYNVILNRHKPRLSGQKNIITPIDYHIKYFIKLI